MNFLRKSGLIQWSLAGVLLSAGFIYTVLWPLGILGLAYFIYLSSREISYKKAALGGLIAWTIKSLAALMWFLSVYPVEWLTVSLGNAQLLIVVFYWVTNSLWLGVAGIFVAVAIRKVCALTNRKLFLLLLIPGVWLMGELLGSLFFSVMTYGDAGVITSAFSFGYMGYLLAQHEWLVQLARVGGVYGLNVSAVVLALVFLWSVKKMQRKNSLLWVLFFGGFWLSAYLPFISTTATVNEYYSVLTIDTTFPVMQNRTLEGEKRMQDELEVAMQTALSFESDYILLPEDARYFKQLIPSYQEKALFQFLNENPKTIVVDSGRVLVDDEAVLQSFTYNGLENTVDISHKRYLVPQGEFMPYFYSTIIKLAGYGEVVETIEKDISYTVGTQTSQADAAASTPGILYCFESVSPWGVKKIIDERGTVPFIAHPVSHGWFNNPTILWENLDSMLKIQAVWNQQYIVSAGGHAVGKVCSPTGEIQSLETIASGENWKVRQTFIPVLQ